MFYVDNTRKVAYTVIISLFILVNIVILLILLGDNSSNTPVDDKSSIYNSSDLSNTISYINESMDMISLEPISTTDEEKRMLYCIVEMEAHGLSYYHKQIITCVILNRVDSELFKESSI